ncbi:hypothetical protein ES765_20625 [Maribacter sp. ACAM166]|nr:hypothetical protein ES765_20625 [Maribacter sp. ACAM166]
MTLFCEALPTIREKVDEDLQLKGWPKNQVLRLIMRLMEETHIRFGNEQYAKRNKTYGRTTLRIGYLKISNSNFKFTGKKGRKYSITTNKKPLRKLVIQCE